MANPTFDEIQGKLLMHDHDGGDIISGTINGAYLPPALGALTVTDTATVDLTLTGSDLTADVINSSITYAKMQNVSATSRILGRITALAGPVEELTAANVRTIINVADGANAYVHPNHSGDVTSVADGAQTIATGAVTLAKMADMATASFLGRNTALSGVPEVISTATAKTMLSLGSAAYTASTDYVPYTGATANVDLGAKNLTTTGQITTPLIIGTNIKPSADSTTAIQLQNAAGTNILNVDTTNSRVGIGTTEPDSNLVVSAADASTGIIIETTAATIARYPGQLVYAYGLGHPFSGFYRASGTKAAPTAMPVSVTIGAFVFSPHTGTAFREVARFGAATGPNFSETNREGILTFRTATGGGGTFERMVINHLGNVGIGTGTPTANLQITQGTAGAGTVSTPGSSTTLTGVGTQFTNTFKVGDTLTVVGETVRTINTITSDTVLDVTVAFSATTRSAVAYTLTSGTRFSVLGNGNVGIGTTAPYSLLDVSSITGGVLTISRNDTSVTAADSIGTLQFKTNDTQTTSNLIAASIAVTAQNTIATDINPGDLTIAVTGTGVAGALLTHIECKPTTVAALGFFGSAPVVKPTALTTQLTTITATAPGTPDYAIADLTQTLPYGFVSADEGQSVLKVIVNLQVRISELETRLQALGLLS